jgi:hypothetical protein
LLLVGGPQLLMGLFPFALCAGGCLLTAELYGKWSDSGHAASFLMLPATVTEKYLAGILFGLVLFIPLFCILYFLPAFLMLNVVDEPVSLAEVIKGGKHPNGDPAAFYLNTFLVYLLLQPLALYAAVRFNRFQFLWMILITVTIFVVYFYAQHMLMMNLTHMIVINYNYFIVEGNLSYFSLRHGGTYPVIFLKPWIIYLNKGMWLFLAAGLYVAAYLRFKEREI